MFRHQFAANSVEVELSSAKMSDPLSWALPREGIPKTFTFVKGTRCESRANSEEAYSQGRKKQESSRWCLK
jgi:hypothetical protein